MVLVVVLFAVGTVVESLRVLQIVHEPGSQTFDCLEEWTVANSSQPEEDKDAVRDQENSGDELDDVDLTPKVAIEGER